MNTPFPYENIADEKSFYGRASEIKIIKEHIENSTNLLLFSKRRMGKSTLIKNVFKQMPKKYTCIYIDVFNIITAKDFASQLLKAITNAQEGDITTSIKNLTNILKRVRVEPSFDTKTGKMSISPVVSNISFEELIEDAFTILFEIAKKKNICLAIDEFQQIAGIKDVKIDAILRKYIQESHNISYIFLGSKRNILNSLFAYKAPLFEMVTPMNLNSIELEDIYAYAKKHLKITLDTCSYIYTICEGETKLIQMIFHKAYLENAKKKETTIKQIDDILDEILIIKNEHYKSLFEVFSRNQKKAFKLLSLHKKELFSNEVLKQEELSKASMQSALKQLYEKEYIDKEDNIYFIPDRTFELWGERVLNE